MIKKIKLFVNDNERSFRLAKIVKNSFVRNGFVIGDDSFDLGIAVGGDGSFLRMVRSSDFDTNPYYVGINAGTLGFLQEANEHEVNRLIGVIQSGDYKVDDAYIQETVINHEDKEDKEYSLNEIIIREREFKTAKLAVYVDDEKLEDFAGDGLLISTTVGSTGHNLSYGGSIVYSDLPTLQINPIAPINSSVYTNLVTSIIIPKDKDIMIIPDESTNDIMLSVDGIHTIYKDVDSINTSVRDRKVKCLRFKNSNFSRKVNEKLLSK